MKKLKILLITSMPWREDNNIGNSYSNLFGDIDDFEIAHIYCRDGEPYNSKVKKYFQITEGRLVKNLVNPSIPTGRSFEMDASNNAKDLSQNSKIINKARILRWELFFIIRDLIWFLGKWKSKELYQFVEEFKPDIIFATLTYMSNINRMVVDLHRKYNIPLVLYSWDDVYSWHNFSWNPLFLVRKLYNRHYIRKSVKECSLMYTITKEMQDEYDRYFGLNSKILYKSYNFDGNPILKKHQVPFHLVFMGNIGAGRWKALAELAKSLHSINQGEQMAFLDIYTLSPVSDEIRKALDVPGSSHLNKAVMQEEVMRTQSNADILIHVEPLNKRDASFYRLSFSTKIVDYFYNARCIIGMGKKTATLEYIERNDAGIVIYDCNDLKKTLLDLFKNPNKIQQYGINAWNCGVKNHSRGQIRKMLINDLQNIVRHV